MPPKEGGGWSRPSRPAFKATLGLCLPGELACKERSDACTHTGAGGLAHPCSTTREGAPSSRSLRGWDTMPPKEGGGWSRPSSPAFKATLGLRPPGELACKERSDAAGQFVGERAGSARAVGAGRSEATPAPTAKAPPTSPLHRDFTGEQNKSGRPKAARCFLSRSPKPDSRSPP
jgi:hypothetical protein